MATAKTCNELTTYYVEQYVARYGENPIVNRNNARWSWNNVLEDFKPAYVKELIDFYFSANSAKNHDLSYFFWNYEKIASTYGNIKEDKASRTLLAKKSEQRIKEWEDRIARIKDNKRGTDE